MSGDNSGKPRMSLYANLLSKDTPDAPGTISGAPVVYKQNDSNTSTGTGGQSSDEIIAAAKAKLNAAALRFQPTKRPTANAPKSKNLGPKPISATTTVAGNVQAQAPAADLTGVNRQTSKTTIEDWAGDDDDVYYQAEKRQRGGRKKRKKNKEREPQPVNWDDIYDPSRPNNYEEYKNSEERVNEVREWKDRLYAHRMNRRGSSDSDSDEDERRPALRNQFAPPGMSFAPPTSLNNQDSGSQPSPPPPPADVPLDPSAEDPYTRRLRLTQQQATQTPPLPPPNPTPTISRAPVRYNLPPAPTEIPSTEAELESALQTESELPDPGPNSAPSNEPRSLRPGQAGFAQRMMAKYGWTKGSGLGAQGTGITSALRVQVEKQKRKPDSEGGGFAGPGGRGKIIGGKRQAGVEEEEGKFGAMSEVVVLRGMVDGMDLRREMGEGDLMQEIGEECGEKYGRVERVMVDQGAEGSVPVFVKFTSQLSALRAVNALEGRIFNGNEIRARFYDKDEFDRGNYGA